MKQIIAELTPVLRGWGNYFRTGNADREFNKMDYFVVRSFRRWQYRRGGQRPTKRRSIHRRSALWDGTVQVDGHCEIPGASHTQKIIVKPCAGKRHARFERGTGEEGKPERWSRPRQGTPQGGVISPLLSNLYLHWFDKMFYRADGPAQWAGAKLARHQGTRLTGWIESKLEGWLGLEINREKTGVVNLKEEGASLDFLGFTFRRYESLQGHGRYLNVSPSAKALKKERDKLYEMTDHRQCYKPIPRLVEELNRHLKGWKNYFDFGYPRQAFRDVNTYVHDRLWQHLRRRSQRPFRPPEGVSFYKQVQCFGLVSL